MNIAAFVRLVRVTGFAGALLVTPALAGRMDHVENRTETKRFTLAAVSGQRELVVDNVIGSITVRAGSGESSGVIDVTVKESYAGETAADLARAFREVELEAHESAGRLELVQGGSWRCRRERDKRSHEDGERDKRSHEDGERGKRSHEDDERDKRSHEDDQRGQRSHREDEHGRRSHEEGERDRRSKTDDDDDWSRGGCCCDRDTDRDYQVRYDWTLTVPRDLDLTIRNVNDGAIRVEGVNGRLRVRHVNDDVTLADVSGRVDAKTINGELKVDFRTQPSGDSRFATVNGDIDLAFPKGLGARLSFATLNGEVFTDFPFTQATNPPPPVADRGDRGAGRRGRSHHGLGRRTAAILGSGGHALDCDTVNGNITIRERG